MGCLKAWQSQPSSKNSYVLSKQDSYKSLPVWGLLPRPHISIYLKKRKSKPFIPTFVLSIHTQTVFYATKFFKIFSRAVTAKIYKNKCPLLLCSYQEAEQQLHFIMCQHAGITFHFLFAVAWPFFSLYQLTANEVTNSRHKTETNSLHMLTMWVPLYQVSTTAACSCAVWRDISLTGSWTEFFLGCFRRKKAGLFSRFFQMLVPFSRGPDNEDQLKKGVHIYFERKVRTTSTKWWLHSNVCSVWVEPRCSMLFAPLGLPNNLLFGVFWGKKRQPKNRHQQLNKYRFGRKDLKLTTDRPTMTEEKTGT